MKKIIALTMSVLLMLSFVGCGKKEEAPVGGTDGELSGDIVVWSWDVAAKSLEYAGVEFKKMHPNVNIIIEDIGTGQVYDRLLTRLASKTGLPDVVSMEGERVASYPAKFPDGFADVTDIINEDDFLSVKIAEVKYNDKLIGFPWDGAPAGLFYRADLFEEAGINPDDIKTWDDYIREGKKMEKIGVKMMSIPVSKNTSFLGMLYEQMGSHIFDKDGNSNVNSEEGIKATNTLKKLYDEGMIMDNGGWDGLVTATKDGKVATVPTAVWWAGTLMDEFPEGDGKWRVMALPDIEEGKSFNAVEGGSNILVPQDAPNREAAIEFAKFAMTDVPTQIYMFKTYGLYPSYKETYKDPIFEEELEYFGGQQVWKFFAEHSENIPDVNYTENSSEASDMMKDLQARILLKGADVKESLDEMQKKFINTFGQ